jgi:hypothetical protein
MIYMLIADQHYSENTPEYGHGDYPARITYVAWAGEAETKRKAYAAIKREFPGLSIGGRFGPFVYEATPESIAIYSSARDHDKLSAAARARHARAMGALL